MGEREPMSAERLAELREAMSRCPSCPTCETALELIAEIDRLHAEVVALRCEGLSVAADLVRVTGRDGWPPDAVEREPVLELALRLRRAATGQPSPRGEREDLVGVLDEMRAELEARGTPIDGPAHGDGGAR